MLIYYIPLLILFYNSCRKYNNKVLKIILFFLMLFLCFGYMTGSDWRNYELSYNEGNIHRLVEPGYMWLEKTCSDLGINFWIFHITLKCLCFLTTMKLFRIIFPSDKIIFFVLILWYASYGLFLYINCPFRNLIACGISAFAFMFFFKKKWFIYYIISTIAILFHYSAIVLYILPFVRLEKISSSFLVIFYISIAIIIEVGGLNVLLSFFSTFIPSFILGRMDFYVDESMGSLLSIGLIPRLICLYFLIKHRNSIYTKYIYGNCIFNLAYISLIFSLIYYIFPILFRSALFLGPFYVISIGIGLSQTFEKYRFRMKIFFILMACAITFSTVRNLYYVPYTNILKNCIQGNFYEYSYRDDYNFKYSPYKNN